MDIRQRSVSKFKADDKNNTEASSATPFHMHITTYIVTGQLLG